ncbi:Ribosomal RNA large subunit methyltransferase M [Carnimonas sp. R-84981]|uniref:23S rRNA (cytidine(2498)-2'-O)-methyltransferase RlmM n=1 Tax=Carnimonas bestiolae TaxID=3402172 RepID=UPI003EDBF3C0
MSDQRSSLLASEWLLYCRPGLESDLAAELADRIATAGITIDVEIDELPHGGYVRVIAPEGQALNDLQRQVSLASLVFARQSLVALPPLNELERSDRLAPILDQLDAAGWSAEEVVFEAPDTNEGKALTSLAKALERPLNSQLKRRKVLRRRAGARRLHVFMTSGHSLQLGLSFRGNRSEHPNGIQRLRFPHGAPSRSTLKLEEAWHQFLPAERWDEVLAPGSTAADLGAAPGGWSWQLVNKGMQVYAIDNGPMDKGLMRSGMVEHLQEDGLKWLPPWPLDWLVCDMVERPSRVIDTIAMWLIGGHCRFTVFNLKLPMKRRWQEVAECLSLLRQLLDDAGIRYQLRCRQLYHDREEVTVFVEALR